MIGTLHGEQRPTAGAYRQIGRMYRFARPWRRPKAFAALLETGEGQFNARLVNGFANFGLQRSVARCCLRYSLSRKTVNCGGRDEENFRVLLPFVQEIENAPNDQEAIGCQPWAIRNLHLPKEAFVKIRESQSGAAAAFALHGQEGRIEGTALLL